MLKCSKNLAATLCTVAFAVTMASAAKSYNEPLGCYSSSYTGPDGNGYIITSATIAGCQSQLDSYITNNPGATVVYSCGNWNSQCSGPGGGIIAPGAIVYTTPAHALKTPVVVSPPTPRYDSKRR